MASCSSLRLQAPWAVNGVGEGGERCSGEVPDGCFQFPVTDWLSPQPRSAPAPGQHKSQSSHQRLGRCWVRAPGGQQRKAGMFSLPHPSTQA